MDKDTSVEPNPDKKTKPAASKKTTPKKKTPAKTTAKRKKPSRAAGSSAKTKAATKTASARKKKPAAKKRAAAKTGTPPKRGKRKPASPSKTEIESKITAPVDSPSRGPVVGETAEIRAPAPPVKIKKPQQAERPQKMAPGEIYDVTDAPSGPDPIKTFIRIVFICFVLLMAVMILISYQNMNKYFLTARDGAVEIWKGKFSPKSRTRILIMPGIQAPEQIKNVYTKEEVFPMAFHFYVSKADALMEVPGLPDFVGIKAYLDRALAYATTDALRNIARTRINSIDLMILLYKADAAASKGTVASLETAIKYLDEASTLGPDEIEAKLIKQKLASIQQLKEMLSPKPEKPKPVEDKSKTQPLEEQSSE